MLEGMPAAVRLFARLDMNGECPLDVCEGRRFIEENFKNEIKALKRTTRERKGEKALEFKNVCFSYDKDMPAAVSDMSFEVRSGEIFCLLGGNGSGKSTTLSLAAGLLRPYAGEIKVFGKKIREYKAGSLYRNCVSMLPQDVQALFIADSVKEELEEVRFRPDMLPFDLSPLAARHPYDLSGGEQQLLGLAKVMAAEPRLLLLDEPTKGLDAYAKREIAGVMRALRDRGITLLLVTHDVEFAAAVADRCALMFRGSIASEGETAEFFSENNFYTTAVNRMTRGFYDGILRVREAEEIIRLNGSH
jgi:energy-coupling factor transport system ATP-binding protein